MNILKKISGLAAFLVVVSCGASNSAGDSGQCKVDLLFAKDAKADLVSVVYQGTVNSECTSFLKNSSSRKVTVRTDLTGGTVSGYLRRLDLGDGRVMQLTDNTEQNYLKSGYLSYLKTFGVEIGASNDAWYLPWGTPPATISATIELPLSATAADYPKTATLTVTAE